MKRFVKGAAYNVETMYIQQSYCIYRRGTAKIAGYFIYPRGTALRAYSIYRKVLNVPMGYCIW